MEAGIDEFADFLLAHEDAEAVDVDIFFTFFESSDSIFIDFMFRKRANGHEVDTKSFFQLGETIVQDMTVGIFHFDEVRPVDNAVFIGKYDILRIIEDHDLIRMEEAQRFVDLVVVQEFACRRFNEAVARDADFDQGFNVDDFGIVSQHDFIVIGEDLAFAFRRRFNQGQVVSTENHVLCRNSNRLAVFRSQDVVRRQHERPSFGLGFYRQRQMAGHLVTVEVGVEGRADQRMKLNGPTFPKDRFKGLDAQTVECRGTVQENRMFLDDVFEDVPDFIADAFDFFLGVFNVRRNFFFDELLHDERLEEFQCHFLWKTALVHLHFRADNDNRTAGIVDTFPEQVLTETALLPFQHIRKRFKGTIAGARYGAAAAAIVDEGIDSFLKHALFIADDDVRRTQFKEAAQAVVSVDDPAIEVVQVRRCKTAAVKLDHGAQFWRNDRNDVHDHPFRFIAGMTEGFDDFQAADRADAALARRVAEFIAQLFIELVEVESLEELFNRGGTHADTEFIAVQVEILTIFRFRHQLLLLKRRIARIEDNVRSKV